MTSALWFTIIHINSFTALHHFRGANNEGKTIENSSHKKKIKSYLSANLHLEH